MMKKRLLAFVVSVFILALSFPGIKDLFQPGYYTSHDGEGHVIRMDEFFRAFRDGQFPVRWSPRLYYGYGYPFFNFNYPSTYYLGLPAMLAGFSATWAMKSETIIIYFVSAAVMFWYLRRKVSWPWAVLGAVLYTYAPYRFVNIYVRGSVAEATAFLFPPLLLWVAELIDQRRPRAVLWAGLVLFAVGISHNISALQLFGFYFVYIFYLAVAKKSPRTFLAGAGVFLLGLMMSAFFFIPALTEKKYTFLDQTIAKDYPNYFVPLYQLLRGGWSFGGSAPITDDGLSLNIGWVALGTSAISSILLFISQRGKVSKFIQKLQQQRVFTLWAFTVSMLIFAVFFMTRSSKVFWDHLPLLPFVQFPWRFLLLTVPVLAVMAAITLETCWKTWRWSKATKIILAVALAALTIFLARDQWHINQVLFPRTVAGDALEGTTTWADEQATQWLQPKPTQIPAQKVEVWPAKSTLIANSALPADVTAPVHPQGKVAVMEWKTGRHDYTVTTATAAIIVENTMYYPGWRVKVDGQPVAIDYQNATHPGRLVFPVNAGEHSIESTFGETTSRMILDLISLVTLLGVLGALVWSSRRSSRTSPIVLQKNDGKKIQRKRRSH